MPKTPDKVCSDTAGWVGETGKAWQMCISQGRPGMGVLKHHISIARVCCGMQACSWVNAEKLVGPAGTTCNFPFQLAGKVTHRDHLNMTPCNVLITS